MKFINNTNMLQNLLPGITNKDLANCVLQSDANSGREILRLGLGVDQSAQNNPGDGRNTAIEGN